MSRERIELIPDHIFIKELSTQPSLAVANMEQGIHYNGIPSKNPYQVLGISHKASDADIKNAYRRLVLQLHPDKHPGEDLDTRWHEIKEAHAFLSDAERAKERNKFDAHLASVEASERVCQMASERVRQEEEERSTRQDEEERAKQTEDERMRHREGVEDEGSRDEEEGSTAHTEEEISDGNSSDSSTNIDPGQRKNEMHDTSAEESAHQIATKLATRAYHLPGYDWRNDWSQYLLNNHLLFGVCCHHSLHPVKLGQRMFFLLGSCAYGVAITNAISLWFLITGTTDEDQALTVNLAVHLPGQPATPYTFPVTMGMLVLLTAGSGTHALFDHLVWNLKACGGCRSVRTGYYLLIVLAVAMAAAFSSCILVLSASVGEWPNCGLCDPMEETPGEVLDVTEMFRDQGYSFMTAYVFEFAIASFVYSPIFETLLFSGIFGCCGRIPILGGRPYAMRQESTMKPDEKSDCQAQNEESECPSQMA